MNVLWAWLAGTWEIHYEAATHWYTDDKNIVMSMSVWIFVHEYISGTFMSKPQKFSVQVIYGRYSVFWRYCDMLCTSYFVDDVMFAHNGQEQVVLKERLLSDSPGVILVAFFAAYCWAWWSTWWDAAWQWPTETQANVPHNGRPDAATNLLLVIIEIYRLDL